MQANPSDFPAASAYAFDAGDVSESAISRRDALSRALLLVGAAATLPVLSACEKSLLPDAKKGVFFDPAEMAIVTDVADIMIPQTETAGAVKAGVPAFVDTMMLSWAGQASKKSFKRAVANFDDVSKARFGRRYRALDGAQRLAVVTGIDTQSFGEAKASQGAGDYRAFKMLVFLGYTTSKAANPTYVAVPGVYRGDLSRAQRDALVAERV